MDDLATLTGLDRPGAARLLKGPTLGRQERGREYGAAVDDAAQMIWKTLDDMCVKRLTPVLVETAEHLARHGELTVMAALLAQLDLIGVGTV